MSNSSNDERRGGRMGRDNRRDNYDDPERTSGDWRSGPREELLDGDNYRSRYDNRDRRDDRESMTHVSPKLNAFRTQHLKFSIRLKNYPSNHLFKSIYIYIYIYIPTFTIRLPLALF